MEDIVEQFGKIKEAFPETLIDTSSSSLNLRINQEIILFINFKKYPKKPTAKLNKSNGKTFDLDLIISILRTWDKNSPYTILELIEEILLLINSMELKEIPIKKDLIFGLIDSCKKAHPKKVKGLLGSKKGIISEFILPSKACTNPIKDYEIFRPTCVLPLDFSNEGTFISRPNGDLSVNEKLNNIFKKRRFTMLLGFPYNEDCIKCFNSEGELIKLKLYE